MEITKITLLTSAEQALYNQYIPKIDEVWWLKSPGCDHTVQIAHNGTATAIRPNKTRYVRPVLHLRDITARPGDELTIFAYKWTVLDNENDVIAICNRPVTYRVFDEENHDWAHSSLRKWLQQWLQKRQKTKSIRAHKRYRCMNNFGMMCAESQFIMQFVIPLLITLISAGILCPLSLTQSFQVPTLLKNIIFSIATVICIIELLYLCIIVFSPHKDTMLRIILLIVGTMIAISFASWLPSFPAIIFTCAIIAINAICARYLRMIKYYS